MKTPRAILLMLAGLAGGLGIRLAFSSPAESGKSRSRRAGEVTSVSGSPTEPGRSKTSASRPSEAEILAARGGLRLRLFMKWLPGAGDEELRRMAETFARREDGNNLMRRLFMARWAEVNPHALLEWARSKSAGSYNQSWFVNDAIVAWGRVDFDAAWAAALAGQPATRAAALLGLTFSDPDKCLRLLRADHSLLELGGYTGMEKVITALAARNPAGVIELVESANPGQRLRFAGNAARALAKSDPAAAVAWIAKLELSERTAAAASAGRWLAPHAPEQASALAQSLPAGQTRTTIEARAIARLASTDPAAARAQLDAMPPGPARQYGRALLLKELHARGDETGAIALASRLGWTLADEWSPAWSETVTPVFGERDVEFSSLFEAMAELMGQFAARDPQQAAAVLAAATHDDAEIFLSGMKNTRPAALADALLAAGDEQSLARFETLTSHWKETDPDAAASWAVARGGKKADQFLTDMVSDWGHDPASALAWAAKLTPEQRLPLLLRATRSWGMARVERGVDVAGAIEASSLPAAEKKQLLGALPTP